MQYENNLRKNVFYREKKQTNNICFSKSLFPKGTSGKRGSSYNQGRLIFGSIRYVFWKMNPGSGRQRGQGQRSCVLDEI